MPSINASTEIQELPYAKFKQGHGVSTGLYVGLWIFFFFLYVRPQDVILGMKVFRPILVLMALLVLAFLASNRRGSLTENSTFFKALLLFGGITAWSVPFSYYPRGSFDSSLDFLKIIVACYLVIKILDSFKRIERILLLINLVMAAFALDITKKYLAGQTHGQIHAAWGAWENANDLAVTFVLYLPMLYYYFLATKNMFLRVFSLCLFGIVLFGIVGTQSRGGMLGAGLVLGLLLLKTEKKVIALVAVGVTASIVLLFAPESVFERLKTVVDYKDDGSAYGRLLFYESSVKMMLDRPLTGVGINAFSAAYAKDFRHPEDDSFRWPDPHSSYFQIIGELGLPGIMTYLFMIYVTFRSLNKMAVAFKGRQECERPLHFVNCLRIGLIGFLFTTIFQSAGYQFTLFILMAFVVAMERFDSWSLFQVFPVTTRTVSHEKKN